MSQTDYQCLQYLGLDLGRARRADPGERQRSHRKDGRLTGGFGRTRSWKNFTAKSSRLSSRRRFRAPSRKCRNCSASFVCGCISSFAVVFGIWITSLIETSERSAGRPVCAVLRGGPDRPCKGEPMHGRLPIDSSLSAPELASLTSGPFYSRTGSFHVGAVKF